jgi:hypothetical protein
VADGYAAFVLDVETPGTSKLQDYVRGLRKAASDVSKIDFHLGASKTQNSKLFTGLEAGLNAVKRTANEAAEAVEKASAKLKAGQRLPANVAPGLGGGLTSAQALKQIRDQAVKEATALIGRQGAAAGIDTNSRQFKNIGGNLVTQLDQGLTEVGRSIINRLRETARKNNLSNPEITQTFGKGSQIAVTGIDTVLKQITQAAQRFLASIPDAPAPSRSASPARGNPQVVGGGGRDSGPPPGGGGGGNRFGDDFGGQGGNPSREQQRANAEYIRNLKRTRPSQVVNLPGGKTADLTRSAEGIVRVFERADNGARVIVASVDLATKSVKDVSAAEDRFGRVWTQLLDATTVLADQAGTRLSPIRRRATSSDDNAQRREAKEELNAQEELAQAQNAERLKSIKTTPLRLNSRATQVENIEGLGFNPDFNVRTQQGFRKVERDTLEYVHLLDEYQRRLGQQIANRIDRTIGRSLPENLRPNELAERAGVRANLAAQRQAKAEQDKRDRADQDAAEKANAARLREGRGSNPFGAGINRAFGRSNDVLTEDSGLGGFSPDFNVRTTAGYRAVERDSDEHLELLKRYQEQEGAGIAARLNAEVERQERQKVIDQKAGKLQTEAERENAERTNARRLQGDGKPFADNVRRAFGSSNKVLAEDVGQGAFNPRFNVKTGDERYRRVDVGSQEQTELTQQFQERVGQQIADKIARDAARVTAQQLSDQRAGKVQTTAEKINKDRDTEARLRAGAQGGRSFNDDVSRVYGKSNRALAEQVPGFNPDFYQKTKDGYEKVERDSGRYLDLLRDYQERLADSISKEINSGRLGNGNLRPNELQERAAEQKRLRERRQADVEQSKRDAVDAQKQNFAAFNGRTQRLNENSGKVQFVNNSGALTFGQSGPQSADPDFLVREGKNRLRLVERGSKEYLDLLDKLQQKLAAEISKALARDEFSRLTGSGRADKLRAGVFSEADPARGFNPDFFDVNEKKQTATRIDANPTREADLLRQYQEKVGREIADALDGTTDRANFTRLRQNATSGQAFSDNVRRVGANLFEEDAANPYQPRAFRANVKQGTATEIPKDTAEYIDLVRKYQEEVGKELTEAINELRAGGPGRATRPLNAGQRAQRRESVEENNADKENLARDNQERLRGGAQGAGNGREFADGVVRVNDSVVADTREAILRLYQSTRHGYEELKEGTEPYLRAQRSLVNNASGRQDTTVGGSFLRGLTNGGIFGGGGHEGGVLQGLAQAAGTTTKYAVLGNALYGIQGAAKAAVGELLDFQDSVTELNVVLEGSGNDRAFINELSESAARAGANVGQAMDVAASGMRAFGDQTDGSKQSMEALGVSFATQASRIATLTKTDIGDAAGNLKAAALGFDVPPEAFSRITDVLVGAKKIGGGDEKQVGQALANIATGFKEIGFTAEESGAIVSKVIAETDQGGQLVASKLSRITSIIGGSAGQTAIRDLNGTLAQGTQIDLQASVADQIKQLGAVYNQLSDVQRKPLINALGGTASSRELEILLGNITQLEKDANDPKNFNGKGAEEYKKRLSDLRAVLTQITGEAKNAAAAFLTSGIFDPFFAFIKYGLLPGLRLTRELLQLFGEIPGPLRIALGILASMVVAQKALRALGPGIPGQKGGIGGFIERVENRVSPGRALARDQRRAQQLSILNSRDPNGGRSRESQDLLDSLHGDALTEDKIRSARDAVRGDKLAIRLQDAGDKFRTNVGRAGTGFVSAAKTPIASLKSLKTSLSSGGAGANFLTGGLGYKDAFKNGGIANGIKGIGKLTASTLASELGPIGIALGTATIIQGTIAATRRIHSAVSEFNKISLLPEQDVELSADGLKNSAANLRAAANTLDESTDGFFGKLVSIVTGSNAGYLANTARAAASAQEFASNEIDNKKGLIAKRGVSDDLSELISFDSNDEFTQSIDSVKSTGADAAHQMEALQGALAHLIDTSKGGITTFNELEKYTLRVGTAAGAESFLATQKSQNSAVLQQQPSALKQALTLGFATPDKKTRAAIDTARTNLSKLNQVDSTKLNIDTQNTIQAATASGLDVVNSKEDRQAVYTSLVGQYEKDYGDPKLARQAADNVVRQLIHNQENISTKGLDVDFGTLTETITGSAAARGTSHANRARLGIPDKDGRLTGQKTIAGVTVSDSADLVGAKVNYNEIEKAIAKLEQIGPKTKAQRDKLQALKEAAAAAAVQVQQAALANLQAQQALVLATIAPENTTQVLEQNVKNIDTQLNGKDSNGNPLLTGTDRTNAEAQKKAYLQQEGLAKIADTFADKSSGIDSRDVVGLDKVAADQAAAELKDFERRKVTGKALRDKQREVTDKRRQYLNDKSDVQLAKDNANLDSTSSVDQGIAALNQLNNALKKEQVGTAAYINAKKARDDQVKANAVTDLQAAQVAGNLQIDLTNPVQVANKAVADAQADLDQAKKQNRSADVINTKTVALRNAQTNAEAAAFQEFMTSTQNAQQLGTLSSAAYIRMLQSRKKLIDAEIAQLGPLDNGRKQLQDQSVQLALAIKSASDAFSSQFNIGDIKVPTPYEVRRAIQTGDVGNVAKSNSAFSQNGNVTNDSSQRNVILNGVPIQQVLSIIQDLFGVKVRNNYASKVV